MAKQEPATKPTRLQIQYLSTTALTPNPKNARRHPASQLAKLAKSIQQLGFNTPIAIDEDRVILAGHARYAAAHLLKLAHVPCVQLMHLSAAEKTAFAIADNQMNELSEFDGDLLRELLLELTDVEFDLDLTGFDTAEIDIRLMDDAKSDSPEPADQFTQPEPDQVAVSRPGDLWTLGQSRVVCGNALEPASYEQVLGQARAQLVFTDPPYNVPIQGHVSGRGRVKHREFPMAAGEMSGPDFKAYLATTMQLMAAFSTDGSIHFVCMDWRHIRIALEAGDAVYSEVKNICVWAKSNAGMGSLYRSQHELILVFKNGTARHQNNIELGKHGRNRSNVWAYAGANAFGSTRAADLAAHPTVKPIALVADAIRDCSKRGAIVLDPFVGSGTTILAAEQTGRRAAAIEIDPLYVDTAIRRWQGMTGKAAVLAADGRSFQEVAQQRLADTHTSAPTRDEEA